MIRNNLWIISLLLISLLVSCNDKSAEDLKSPYLNEPLFLSLYIMPSNDLITKVDSDGFKDDENEEGSYLENYIDIENNDFHIALFNSSGDFVTEFIGEDVGYKNENNETATHLLGIEIKYDRLKRFPSNYGSEEFTVVILANWRSYSEVSYVSFEGKNLKNIGTEDNFYNFSYTGESKNSWYPTLGPNSKSLILMMGIGKFTGFVYSSNTGMHTAHANILMLRSLAKITLSLNDKLWKSGFEIGSCKLNKFVSQGKVIPDLSKEDNTVGLNGSIHVSEPWNTQSFEKTDTLSFVKIGEEGTNQILTAYVPEMNTAHYTTSSSDRPLLTASLTLNKKKFKEDKSIEFNDNQDTSNLFHILRNHHYNFIIEDISEEGKITLSYTACPWNEGSADIGFH